MNKSILYSDNPAMKILTAVVIVIVLICLYKYFTETAIGNPYAGTSYGFYPYQLFGSTFTVPAVNY